MKIVATVKRTPQRDTRMKLTADGALVTDQVQYEVNPFDELAVEEALRIRENGADTEVIALTVGPAALSEQLQTALAMGADRAVRVDTDEELEPLQVAHALAAAIRRESPDLVLMGKLAIDAENGQVPLMVAELLDWPHASFASKIELEDGPAAKVTCEVDGGLEVVRVGLPAVITTDLRLNEPRYASLPGILKAKKKPQDVIPLTELGDVPQAQVRVTSYGTLPPREQGEILESAEQLADVLISKNLI